MKVVLYKRFERFWHWSQSLLMIFMLITGFEIHGSYKLLGFGRAVLWHEYCAFMLMGLWVFAIFWHFTTGEWRQYLPTPDKISTMLRYYSSGIFKGAPYPFHPSVQRKHNPLQRMAYLTWKLLMAPVIWVTGLLLLFYAQWESWGLGMLSLGMIATLHLIAAFLILAFLIGHVYMTTTGDTPLAHIKTMLRGYEETDEVSSARTSPPSDQNQ
ncbi:cytochrome b/b6 domain-containing protein [Vibrio sp. CAU 1672]|uniref:cytochrome b/b6 domain-containing protein n=1 Tax=Vibrio sp. CAU 1672 TaxID=3032594 RepID=UPI0023DA5720|nr:cytochrome b/b6 domain-containing protein [Vibrio sp. CAU 1672]MDF2153571.1 cytochrome b/b6 domain-containing protein [Vibrio sp. CAU 1672]